jgi:hypothetical protein
MTRISPDRDHREDPISGTVRWPGSKNGKIDMRLSRNSMEKGISVYQQLE